MFENFHFLRPEWFFAILALLLIAGLFTQQRLSNLHWESAVDKKLLPHLLLEDRKNLNYRTIWIFVFAGFLAITALAGPTWEKIPQPVFKKQTALLIAISLSRSMDAIDLTPSRLIRARYKVLDILQLRKEGQTGLIVYAADAFTVTPLSEDPATISALLPSLNTGIMPTEGSNTTKALNKAVELLINAGFSEGDILLVADSINEVTSNTLKKISERGFRVSILAAGTINGAPIPLKKGGFLKDLVGNVIVPKLALEQTRILITKNGGIFSHLSIDDSDLDKLMPLIEISAHQGKTVDSEVTTDVWHELGPWLLIVLIPLTALVFRRGYLILAFAFILPLPQPAQAFNFSDLFNSNNERAMLLYKNQEYDAAAKLFDDKQWKASAYYRASKYALSLTQLQKINTATAYYNRGNALTQQNRLSDAIKAYSTALEIDPEHEDASYNKILLEKWQKEEQENKSSRKPEQQEDDESKESEPSNSPSANQMKPRPMEKDKQKEDTEESESPSNNERRKDSVPGESEDRSNSSSESSPDKRNQGRQSQNQVPEQEQNKKQNKQKDQELEQKEQEDRLPQVNDSKEKQNTPAEEETNRETDTEKLQPLSDKTIEQWLNKVEDESGDLLKRKFKYLSQQQQP